MQNMGDYRNNSEPNHKVESYYWAMLPMAGQSVFGHLCRKTNTRRKEDTRSGTEKRCSHILFHTIFPCMNSNIFVPCPHSAFALCFIQSL